MTRVKRGVGQKKRVKKVLKRAKGFKWGRKSKYRLAKEGLTHAGVHAFRGRKEKKRNFRRLWQLKINAAARERGITYSQFIFLMAKTNIKINRKILAQLAENYPLVFDKIIESVKAK